METIKNRLKVSKISTKKWYLDSIPKYFYLELENGTFVQIRVGVIFSGYSILQEKLHDAVRFFETCTAKTKKSKK